MSASPMRNLLRRRSGRRRPGSSRPVGSATAARATQAAQKLKHPLKLEPMRAADVRQIKNIDQIAQTFNARVFIQFRIDGGALDEALCEGLNASPPPEPALAERAVAADKLEWHNAAGAARSSFDDW